MDIKSREVTFGCATRFGRDIFSIQTVRISETIFSGKTNEIVSKCGLPPREDDPPVELHILYQPGAETMQEGDEEGAERELAARRAGGEGCRRAHS